MFKSHSISIFLLVEVSKALNYNFLFDLALLVEDKTNVLPTDTARINCDQETMVTLRKGNLKAVGVEEYLSILDEYISTTHRQPLLL